MMYKALVSFTGVVSMADGDVREISDVSIARDLLKAGYIEEFKETPQKSTVKKTSTPKGKENK